MKGTTVRLAVKTVTGYDPFGAPIETEELVEVDDVLIGQPSSDDVTSATQLHGARVDFVLGIPKGDTHEWRDTFVEFWGKRFRTVGEPATAELENIPLRWGSTIKVERYE